MAVEQLTLVGVSRPGIVNVASVPMRSPFRYPGGKTWLVPCIRRWLRSYEPRPAELIEPFAGGGIVGLTAAFENLAERVTLVELDHDIACVWHTIINGLGTGAWLAEQIASFRFSGDSVAEMLSKTNLPTHERAFVTLLRNRVSRGGILAPGAGIIRNGENGRGLASRWYPKTLRKRILDIVAIGDRLCFFEGDGVKFINDNASRRHVVFFIDPPYTVAGRRLYKHSEVDHAGLFDTLDGVGGDFLLTYDDSPEIRLLAEKHGFPVTAVPMKSTHHRQKLELLISRDLGWLD